jgi:protoheme IX farnesyltransferase
MKAIAAVERTISFFDYVELTKPRITTLVLTTTLVGFYLASRGPLDLLLLLHTLLGTGLVAAGASALNMALEYDNDAKMRRTENRPIPSGRLTPLQALSFGGLISIAGVLYLFVFVNLLTAMLGAITSGLYLLAYTPLKTRTPLCTMVGAVPGAIPPMMGWTAVQNNVGFGACWLFAVLFLWQLPHFLSIAWLYKEDYARGGFPMLPVVDTTGARTSRHIILETLALVAVSILPALLGFFSKVYLAGALVLGVFFFMMGVRLVMHQNNLWARRLLLASVIYLPLLLALMMLDKSGLL